MTKRAYRRLVLAFLLTVILIGTTGAQSQTQATLSVGIHPDATSPLSVRVSPQEGYAIASKTHQPTGTTFHLMPVRPGHSGEGKINYQVTPNLGGSKVTWNSHAKETLLGAGTVQAISFQSPTAIPVPSPPLLPPFPPVPAPAMGLVFPMTLDTAQSVSDSTGEGMVNYQKAADGSGQSLSWSSSSTSTIRTTWPSSHTSVPGTGKAK